MFFELVIDDAGPWIRITRLADGTYVHQDLCVWLDRLFADVIDIWQFLPAVHADQRRMAVAAETERILLIFEIQLDRLFVTAVIVVVRRVRAVDQIEIFIGRKRFRQFRQPIDIIKRQLRLRPFNGCLNIVTQTFCDVRFKQHGAVVVMVSLDGWNFAGTDDVDTFFRIRAVSDNVAKTDDHIRATAK